MPSSGLAVLVDNTNLNFTFNSPWSLSLEEPIWLNETYTAYNSFGEGNGTLSYGFEGTALAFYGHADGQLLASIDGASPSYHPPNLQFQIYQQWFGFADLADTHHNISFEFSTQVYLDYAVISAGQSTPLQGRSIIVDDSDTAMNYTGTWIGQSDQMFSTGDGLQQIPHGKSIHRSTKAGDYALLQFTGSSISVYGVVQWQNRGRISTVYTIDGSDSPHTTTINSNGDHTPYADQPNYLFYHADLTPGNHTLVITITEVTNQQAFILDYILYDAAFDNVATMPTLTPGDIHPWTPPRVIRAKKPFPTGAIIGAAVGAAALLALLVFLIYRTTKRKRPKSPDERPEIDPLPEPAVPSTQPPSYTPTISLYQPSHSDFGVPSFGRYPGGSSMAGTSSTYHTPSAPTTLPPHSHSPYLRPFSASSSDPSMPLDNLPPRSPRSEKRESVVHHPQGSRLSVTKSELSSRSPHPSVYYPPATYEYGSGNQDRPPTDVDVYRI